MKRSFFQAAVDTAIWMHYMDSNETAGEEARQLDGSYTRMLRAILNKSWSQHPTKHQWTATYLRSWKLSKLDEPDMQDADGEVETSS